MEFMAFIEEIFNFFMDLNIIGFFRTIITWFSNIDFTSIFTGIISFFESIGDFFSNLLNFSIEDAFTRLWEAIVGLFS